MGLANTLSVLLSFKTDLSGLDKFVGAIQSRLQQVQEFNAKVSNGAAAVNNALQAAAGVFAVSQLREYSREALQARAAQGQLAQALKSQKQDSAAYRAELSAQASALQRRTGIEDEVIAGVQRQLVFAKAQRQDIAELTALTLDFAAAKEIDGVSAAKAVGRALQGEGDELKRYGVEIDLAVNKVEALKNGLGKFRGQAETAFSTLPQGMREFKVAAKEAEQSAGEALLGIAGPFLSGVAGGLQSVKDGLDDVGGSGSIVREILQGVARALGSFIGANLDRILLLVAAMLALKSSSYFASEAIKVLAAGFLALTQKSFIQVIADLQMFSKELGLLQTLSLGGWPMKLAFGLSLVAAALAGLAIGSTVINAVEAAQLARLEKEQKIRDVINEQTRSLQRQAADARTDTDVKGARDAAQKRVDETKQRIAELEKMVTTVTTYDVNDKPSGTETVSTRSRDQEAELEQLRQELPLRQRALDYVNSQAFATRAAAELEKDRAAAAARALKLTPEQRAARDELELKRQLFDLDTAIKEAELDHNDVLVDRLTRERDEFALLQQLGPAAYEIIQARLAAEYEERKKQREREQTERDIFALETRATEAEAAGNTKLAEQIREQAKAKQLALEDERRTAEQIQKRLAAERAVTDEQRRRQALEQDMSRRIAAGEAAVKLIEQTQFLTEQQKNQAKITVYQKINEEIAKRIELLEKQQALSPDTSRQQTIDQLRQQQGQNNANIQAAQPLSLGQSVGAGLVDYLNQVQTLAQQVRSTVLSIGQALQQGIASSITGLINRTMTWRDALLNIGQSVVTALIGAFANMAAQWIAKQLMMALFGKALQVAQLAALAPVAAASAALWAPAATAASIATLGAAAIEGAAMAKAAIISSALGFASGGIVRGPGTGTSDSILARLSNGEGIINARGTAMVGEEFINSLNAGVFDLSTLSGRVAGQIPSASSSGSSTTVDGGVASGASGSQRINVFVHTDESIGRAWLERQSGRKILYRQLSQDRREMGVES